mgnify:CR=1 FL=1
MSALAVAGGIGITNAVLSGYANIQATKAKGKAVREAIYQAGLDYQRQIQGQQEQEDLLEVQTRQMLSERGLEALKAESRIRTAISGSGLSGSTMNEVQSQANFDKLFDNAVIIGRATVDKENLAREKLSQYMAFTNRQRDYANQMTNTSSTASAIMGAISTGLNTAVTAYQLGYKTPTGTPQLSNVGKDISSNTQVTLTREPKNIFYGNNL